IKAGQTIAEIETDKATMETESQEAGTVAAILVREGQKVPVGTVLAVLATGAEKAEDLKKQYASGAKPAAAAPSGASPAKTAPAPTAPAPATGVGMPRKPATAPSPAPAAPSKRYDYDIVVIGGGPAGYAAAIRAGQLKKRVFCIEKENIGGTCLNWGCIPTKALLEDGAFIRRLRTEADKHGLSFQNLQIDFSKLVGRSRNIADKLAKGVAHLFNKYGVQTEKGTGQLIAPHRVRITTEKGSREITAEHVILASGAKATPLPFAPFDGKLIISSREAMTLAQQPKRMAIIGAGAIGCEFADFYNAIGTEVTIIEMLPQILPNEDDDVARVLKNSFTKRGINVFTGTKTDKVEKSASGVKLTLSGENAKTIEADVVLVAIGVTGYV